MKILPLVFLSLLAGGCASDQQRQEDVIQKDEDIQMQEEEMSRTGASDDIGPGYREGTTSTSPYQAD